MTTYLVQIQTAQSFRDVYVQARNENDAIRVARRQATAQEIRWASFVL